MLNGLNPISSVSVISSLFERGLILIYRVGFKEWPPTLQSTLQMICLLFLQIKSVLKIHPQMLVILADFHF